MYNATERVSIMLIEQQGNAFQRWQYFMSFHGVLIQFKFFNEQMQTVTRDIT